MAKLTTFKAGYCTHISCVAVKGSGWKECQFPAQVFLLEVNDRFWVVDTGYATHFMDHTKHGIYKLYGSMPKVYFNESEAIIHQLKANGIDEKEIEGIIITHFHGDHIAGLRDFPNSTFIGSGVAFDYLKPKKNLSALLNAFVPGLIPDDFTDRFKAIESFEEIDLPAELAPFEKAYIVPNSNREILLVNLPGHAIGHYGVFVLTESGFELIAADAAWRTENYRNLIFPSAITKLITYNSKEFKNTLHKLHKLDANNIKIHLSHEEK